MQQTSSHTVYCAAMSIQLRPAKPHGSLYTHPKRPLVHMVRHKLVTDEQTEDAGDECKT